MNKFRESKVLDWSIFNGHRDFNVYGCTGLVSFMVLMIFALVMTAGPYYFNPALFIPPVVALWVLITAGVPNLGRLHALSGLRNNVYNYSNNRPMLRDRGFDYLSLSTADRALYPVNILDILKNPDLSEDDKRHLDSKMKDIYRSIVQRDLKKAELSRQMRIKNVNIEDIVARLEDSHGSVKAETSVWNEELARVKDERRLGIN